MRYFLIHGFNVSDQGQRTVGKVLPVATGAGIDAEMFSYPWTFLFSLAARTEEAVTRLIELAGTDEIGVLAHSHGNVIALEAARRGVKIRHWIAVAPALYRKTKFPDQVRQVDLFYNEGDYTVEWARVWRGVANAMPWRRDKQKHHWWGAMGRHGIDYQDNRVTSRQVHADFGHSGYFHHAHMLRQMVSLMHQSPLAQPCQSTGNIQYITH